MPVTGRFRPATVAVVAGVAVQGLRWARVVRSMSVHREHWRYRADLPGELRYVALGDSLAQGIGASSPERGFVGLLAARLAACSGRTVRVVNLSVTGLRLDDLRLDGGADLAAADLVTVVIGTNDAGRTPPDRFRARFRELCSALPPGALVADLPDVQAGPRRRAAAQLSAVARSVLAEHPTLVPVALEAATSHLRIADYCPDLFHPSDAGYRRYAAAFERAGRARNPAP